MELIDVKSSTHIDFEAEGNDQNTKIFLKKATFEIGQKKFLLLKKITLLYRKHMLLVILTVNELFYAKEMQKANEKG